MLPAAVRVLLVALIAGCATSVDARDHSVLMPTLRASKQLGKGWRLGVVADYSDGSDGQSLAPGDFIEIGGANLTGDVHVDFEVITVRVEGRRHYDWGEKWLGEWFVGGALYEVDVTVTDADERGSDDQLVAGPLGGGRIGWRPVPRLTVYGEAYGMVGFTTVAAPMSEFEAGVEFHAFGPVNLFAGWRFRDLELYRSDSDFDLEWSGAFLGLGFDF